MVESRSSALEKAVVAMLALARARLKEKAKVAMEEKGKCNGTGKDAGGTSAAKNGGAPSWAGGKANQSKAAWQGNGKGGKIGAKARGKGKRKGGKY